MIRRKNVNEVKISAEMFYQRQCKLKCAQRWRGKIQRHKNVLDLQDRRCCSLASSRVEVCDLDVLAELISILMGRLASWSDRDLQNAIAARTEEIIRFDDLIELEIVRQQRRRIEALRLHHCINRRIRSFPPGQRVVTIL
jgi:hypothetical protein